MFASMLTPTDKGNIAEAKIAADAIELGFAVSRPLCEGRRYDLIFDVGTRLFRVQCKWAPRTGDVVRVNTRTSRHTPRGYVAGTYTAGEIDLIAAYCPQLDRCYALPVAQVEGQTMVFLRLAPARNNQASGINWASQFELGAIAQLGERRAGSAKVAGSSPASSIA